MTSSLNNPGFFSSVQRDKQLPDVRYDYNYPFGRDLRPGSDLHDRLVAQILDRAVESHRAIGKRHDTWEELDKIMTAYIWTDSDEAKEQAKDERKPVSMVVPMSYAILETLLTHMCITFLRGTTFKYTWVEPNDRIGAILLERLIEHQFRRAKMALNLHTMWRDAFIYGIGIVSPRWRTIHGKRRVYEQTGFFSRLRNGFVRTGEVAQPQLVTLYEGNELTNIDPYKFLPDPGTSIHDLQKAEFVGWIDRSNRTQLLRQEQEGDLFNVRYLKHMDGTSNVVDFSKGQERQRDDLETNPGPTEVTSPVDVIWMYWDLIPQEFGLGKNKYPERWLFGLAGDRVLIQAQPLNLDHNLYPAVACAPDFTGYNLAPVSKLEVMQGLQRLANFNVNSHVANKRKVIHDMFVVDPEKINVYDFENPKAGGIIRLRRNFWGRGVQDAIEQLKVQDVTQQNIQELPLLFEMGARGIGANDALQGIMQHRGERRSADESRGSRTGAVARLDKMALVAAIQAHYDLGMMLASHTQQFISEETYVDITGRWSDLLIEQFGSEDDRVRVSPRDVRVGTDVLTERIGDRTNISPETWAQYLQIIAQNQELSTRLDVSRIFKYIVTQYGHPDIQEFERNQQVAPRIMNDSDVIKAVEAGNLVAAQGANGAQTA